MKDAYSFDISKDDARKAYNRMFVSYLKTFKRLDLTAIPMEADTGPIGGDLSHEFIILADTGESGVFFHKDWEQTNLVADISYDEDLQSVVDSYTSLYAKTDETHDEATCPVAKDKLLNRRGIEVGHIFYFGTKYSQKMGATVSGPNGEMTTLHMGSYGIGVSRLVGAVIEANHDKKGIVWPASISPFDAGIVNLKPGHAGTDSITDQLYQDAKAGGFDILLDDSGDSAGAKLASMDLIGLPWQAIAGPRSVDKGVVEIKNRKTGASEEVTIKEASARFLAVLSG